MRYLVTGATGFIGANLVRLLIARGHQVRAFVRPTSVVAGLEQAGVELVRGDVIDPYSLAPAVEGCEVVVHLAGVLKAMAPADYFHVNAEGTANVGLACANASSAARMIMVSSLAAAGPATADHPRTEDEAAAPVSLYGQSKLEAERAVRMLSSRLEATIVRPPIVYGPFEKEFLPAFIRMAKLGIVIKVGWRSKKYSLVHVDDLCEGILAAAERGKRVSTGGNEGIYFFSDGEEHTWEEIGKAACDAVGSRGRVLPLPETAGWLVAAGGALVSKVRGEPAMLSFDKMREIREVAWTCSIAKARAELGYEPKYSLAAGMRQAIEATVGSSKKPA